ncbi:MAG TPA: Uma2 family endonuclease [Pyrinomonadaceae bacterium]|nr:Uma2 family endonuclease [Pyrinomonadaceae bacterium]
MTATLTPTQAGRGGLVIHFGPVLKKMTEDEFFDFCAANKDLRIELTAEGDLIVMPPTGGKTGNRNFNLVVQFGNWVARDKTGLGFVSSTLFTLPNGAKRSPDVSWVRRERWEALSEREREKFPPLCPDFVVELRSSSDALAALRAKMEEYVSNGAGLGFLLDPFERRVYVYRPGAAPEVLDDPETVSGEPVLPGFALDVRALWD